MRRCLTVVGLPVIGLLLSIAGFAQPIKGRVRDSAGKAIPYATINLRSSVHNVIIAYAVTDAGGAYTLPMPADGPLSGLVIEATSIGYETFRRPFEGAALTYDFTLKVSANQLQAVEIKSSRPVLRTHGDTLGYRVADFAGAQDMVIGDVLKKLPGITVGSDGTIRYNNKAISNLYINGDNLLDDKYTSATTTIPHAVVEQVQVIENDQPIKALQHKVMSDDVALNLAIKKGAKMQVVGQERVGAGWPGNYDVDLNAMLFKDNFKGINYLKGNNTGYDLQQELVAHRVSEYERLIDHSTPAALLSLGTVNDPPLSRDRYLFDGSGLLNFNNLVKLRKGAQVKMNAWYFRDNQRQDLSQERTIFLPGDTVQYTMRQHNRYQPAMLHAQLTLNINRDKFYLNDALVLDDDLGAYHSYLNTGDAAVTQVLQDNQLRFSHEFNLIRTFSSKILQAYSYIGHSAEPERRTIGNNFEPDIFNKGEGYGRLVETVDVPTWYTTDYVSVKKPSGLITQSYKTGFSVQSQTLTSDLSVEQVNGHLTPQSDSSTNRTHWARTKIYAEADYDLPGEIWQAKVSLPVSLERIHYSDRRYALDRRVTAVLFDPVLKVKYRLGTENYLSFSYELRKWAGTIEDIYPGAILKDYLTLYANSGELTERVDQHASAGFSYRKSLKMLFASLGIRYDRQAADKIASAVISHHLQQQVMLPYPNVSGSWAVSGSVSKYFFSLRSTFSVDLQWERGRSVQLQNGQLLPFHTITKTGGLGVSTKAGDHVAIDYKGTFIRTASHSEVDVSAGAIDQLQQRVSLEYDPVMDVQLKLSGEHYFTWQEGSPELKYFFADASARFRVRKWKTSFEVSAVNFLNGRVYRAFYLLANTFTASTYALPGRVVLVKGMWNL